MTPADRATHHRSATMTDVARLAGVSLGTVSHALNHPSRLTATTLARVEKAIDDLGFRPNNAARSLVVGTSETIGMVLADLSNSYFVDLARGAELAVQEQNMFLTLANSDVDPRRQRTYLELFSRDRVAGALLAPVPGDLSGIEGLRRAGTPFVLLDVGSPTPDVSAVRPDNEAAGYLAARHLIELGRRRLMFASGPMTYAAVRDRLAGVQRAITERGASYSLRLVSGEGLEADDGRKVGGMLAAWPRQDLPDGVIAASDLLAMGLQQVLLGRTAIAIPDDIALVACEDNRSASDAVVPISAISLEGMEVGGAAARLLLRDIAERGQHVRPTVVVAPRLVVRESSVGRLAR